MPIFDFRVVTANCVSGTALHAMMQIPKLLAKLPSLTVLALYGNAIDELSVEVRRGTMLN